MVFLAHETALGRKVAIKVLLPSLLRGTAVVERFRREARIAASLRHRNITSIFDLKETSKLMFFVMEYVEGRALESILAETGALAVPVALVVLHDVASALSYAHQRNITHRDIKPANIIIDTEGMAVVTDFGVAKIADAEGLTSTGSAVGSPRYMTPEQWSGEASHLSDQYSLGCAAYKMLSGEVPCEADSIESLMKKQLFEVPEDLATVRPDSPPELAAGGQAAPKRSDWSIQPGNKSRFVLPGCCRLTLEIERQSYYTGQWSCGAALGWPRIVSDLGRQRQWLFLTTALGRGLGDSGSAADQARWRPNPIRAAQEAAHPQSRGYDGGLLPGRSPV
ncbi:MAG: serine/threonine protein kinase [Gemmatimonadota bacterium]|nr:MAG: serine/threonine protein kinase [Gemmatimonadota bacterium]